MGTSKSISTPSGGKWRTVKSDITSTFSGSRVVSNEKVVSDVFVAAKETFGGQSRVKASAKTVANLSGFGNILISSNIQRAFELLEIDDFKDKPVTEIISIIAERLSSSTSGIEAEILKKALQDTILEASQLTEEGNYIDLEKSLQQYLKEQGIQGLILLFISNYIFDSTWVLIEEYVHEKANDERAIESFMTAYKALCDDRVSKAIEKYSRGKDYGKINWFGKQGQKIALEIIAEIESSIRNISP